MKTTGVLHPALLDLIASAGHGDVILIADSGLRVPTGKPRIDLALTCGVPSMAQTLAAISQELVIEAATVADQFEDWNPDVYREVTEILPVKPSTQDHFELMADMADRAFAYVKTGECTAYASVALVCGVNFIEEAVAQYKRLHPDAADPF